MSRIVLDEHAAGRDPTDRIAREVGLGRLREAAAISRGQVPPLEQEQLDVLHQGHNSLTRALSAILDGVTLRCHPADQPLLVARGGGWPGAAMRPLGVESLKEPLRRRDVISEPRQFSRTRRRCGRK